MFEFSSWIARRMASGGWMHHSGCTGKEVGEQEKRKGLRTECAET